MKNLLLVLLFILVSCAVYAQDVKVVQYSSVMNIELAKDLKEQPITIDVEFVGLGSAGMVVPNKMKRKHITFRCKEVGGEANKNSFGHEVGDFFYIESENVNADKIKHLKKGDALTVTGNVLIYNYYGYKSPYFIVDKVN